MSIYQTTGGYTCSLCGATTAPNGFHVCGGSIPASNLPSQPLLAYGWICPRCGMSNAPFVRQCCSAPSVSGGSLVVGNP